MRALYEATARSAKANRGFTLIELLVVVAIIAILAAIAIPAFNNYRVNAAKKSALANARTCVTVISAHLAENPANTPSGASLPRDCSLADGNASCKCSVSVGGTAYEAKCFLNGDPCQEL